MENFSRLLPAGSPKVHRDGIAGDASATTNRVAISRVHRLVIERREISSVNESHPSDELTLATAAAAISEASGRHIEYTPCDDAVRSGTTMLGGACRVVRPLERRESSSLMLYPKSTAHAQ